jgi:DNA-binding MarR family transcriptional regulator
MSPDDVPPDRPSVVPDPEGEFPFRPEDYALHLASAIALIRDSALEAALRPIGLNPGRYRVLGALARFGTMTMTEVAGFTMLDRTTLTRIADHLVADGHVERIAAPKDRRQVLLEITEAGRECYRAALPAVFAYNRSLLKGLDAGEIRASARTLKLLTANLAANPTIRSFLLDFARPKAAES